MGLGHRAGDREHQSGMLHRAPCPGCKTAWGPKGLSLMPSLCTRPPAPPSTHPPTHPTPRPQSSPTRWPLCGRLRTGPTGRASPSPSTSTSSAPRPPQTTAGGRRSTAAWRAWRRCTTAQACERAPRPLQKWQHAARKQTDAAVGPAVQMRRRQGHVRAAGRPPRPACWSSVCTMQRRRA